MCQLRGWPKNPNLKQDNLRVRCIAFFAYRGHSDPMAKKPLNAQYSLADLAGELRDLNTKVNAAITIGSSAILAGSAVSWFLVTSAIDTSRMLGTLEERSLKPAPLDPVIIDRLDLIIQNLKVGKPQGQQGNLEELPKQIGRWVGVRANSAEQAATALFKSPVPTADVWVYTDNKEMADALVNAFKQ